MCVPVPTRRGLGEDNELPPEWGCKKKEADQRPVEFDFPTFAS